MFPIANKYWPMCVSGYYVATANIRIYVHVYTIHIYLVYYVRLYIIIINMFGVSLAF